MQRFLDPRTRRLLDELRADYELRRVCFISNLANSRLKFKTWFGVRFVRLRPLWMIRPIEYSSVRIVEC